MQEITTINTIELSSICDNTCEYCPATDQVRYRQVGFMAWATFKKAIDAVLYFARVRGSQLELNLFGIGEPTLHPDIVAMVEYARQHLPFKQNMHLNTNGNTMTVKLATDLKRAGISEIDVTGHNPRKAAECIRIFKEVGIGGRLSVDFITQPNNWAGQVDWLEPDYFYPCPWLHRGQVMIMSNGDVTRCCIDARATGVIAHVDNIDWNTATVSPFKLCESCHQLVPPAMQRIQPIYQPKACNSPEVIRR